MSAVDDRLPGVDALLDERTGSRPEFMQPLAGDRVVDAVLRLAMEVCVLRDRMDAYEAVAAEDDAEFLARVEAYEAPADVEQARMQQIGRAHV